METATTPAVRKLRIMMTAAHGAADSEKTPLGGGATICQYLCHYWAHNPGVELTLLAPGSIPPEGVEFRRIDVLQGRSPASLSEFPYASFCRKFESATTQAILQAQPDVVLTHDIAEAPTFALLARWGIPCVPILHVDVLDFFCRMYLHEWITPQQAEKLARRLRPYPIVPDILRLVFDKQAEAAQFCPRLVVPSPGMAPILTSTYPELNSERVLCIPWGAAPQPYAPDRVAQAAQDMNRRLGISSEDRVVCMLSRISPEKGQEVLLQALLEGPVPDLLQQRVVVVICGAAAYMQGPSFMRRLRQLAQQLRPKVRVIFPGHLGGLDKAAMLTRAQVFVSASHHESYGLTTMEAMSYATPVLGLETPGTQATINADCGILIPQDKNKKKALRRELYDLLLDEERCQALAQGAQERAKNCTIGGAAQQLLEALRALAH